MGYFDYYHYISNGIFYYLENSPTPFIKYCTYSVMCLLYTLFPFPVPVSVPIPFPYTFPFHFHMLSLHFAVFSHYHSHHHRCIPSALPLSLSHTLTQVN